MSYADQLWASPTVVAYLVGRGLEPATIAKAQLGYCGQPESEEHARFRGALVIPYLDARGEVQLWRFRYLDGRRQKYDQESGKRHLYNVAATAEPVVYVTEGELDSLIVRQLGHAAVGVGGVKGFQREWRWLFRDCERVTVAFDADEDGHKWGARVAGQISRVTSVRVVTLPPGLDVNDLYLQNPNRLKGLLEWRD